VDCDVERSIHAGDLVLKGNESNPMSDSQTFRSIEQFIPGELGSLRFVDRATDDVEPTRCSIDIFGNTRDRIDKDVLSLPSSVGGNETNSRCRLQPGREACCLVQPRPIPLARRVLIDIDLVIDYVNWQVSKNGPRISLNEPGHRNGCRRPESKDTHDSGHKRPKADLIANVPDYRNTAIRCAGQQMALYAVRVNGIGPQATDEVPQFPGIGKRSESGSKQLERFLNTAGDRRRTLCAIANGSKGSRHRHNVHPNAQAFSLGDEGPRTTHSEMHFHVRVRLGNRRLEVEQATFGASELAQWIEK